MMTCSDPLHTFFLSTRRLGFSYWSADDSALAKSLWGDARVTAYIGGPFSDHQADARLAQEIACQREHSVQYWPVFLIASGELAGCAGLRPYRPDKGICELGVHLRPEFWGKGLAEEACQAVIDFGFGVLSAAALFAGHHPGNHTSQRLLTKLGFEFTHEELYPPTGLQHPSYLLKRR